MIALIILIVLIIGVCFSLLWFPDDRTDDEVIQDLKFRQREEARKNKESLTKHGGST